MTGRRVTPLAIKEVRALLPVWIASAIAITAAVLSDARNHELGLIAYGFGSVALGAQSIGHEYTSRTLTLLLSQPWSRRRLLCLKLAVLSVMLLTLAALAWLTLLKPGDRVWVVVSLLNGLCLAPLLTMACRTPLAAVVFTGAAPFWIEVIARHVSAGVLWGCTLTLYAAAAVAGWRLFTRLEAIDGHDPDVRVPHLFQPAPAIGGAPADGSRRRHPMWLLVKKELHLQQMTFAATGVCTLIWIAIAQPALRRRVGRRSTAPTTAPTSWPTVGSSTDGSASPAKDRHDPRSELPSARRLRRHIAPAVWGPLGVPAVPGGGTRHRRA